MAFKVPEQFRDLRFSSPDIGNNGIFRIVKESSRNTLTIVASDGAGWEHVSVSKKYDCPTWEEMCFVKSLFWDDEDCVVQYHPPKSQYVNNHPNCLHLWRPVGQTIEPPPTCLVGLK